MLELTQNLNAIMVHGGWTTRWINMAIKVPALIRADGILIFGYRAMFYDQLVFEILRRKRCSLVFDIADIPHIQPMYFGVNIGNEKYTAMKENFDNLLNLSDTLLVISPTLAKLLELSQKRTIFVPNASNPLLFKETPIPKNEKKIILYVGGYAPMRGVECLVEAFNLLKKKRQDILLKLVGANMPSNLGQADDIIIETNKFYPDIPEIYSRAYLCVIPHVKNPYMDAALPIKLFDAMASARPIVATDCYETSKLINNEKCGLIAKGNDARSLADSIDYLLQNPAAAQELGQSGRQSVVERHSWFHRAQMIRDNFGN